MRIDVIVTYLAHVQYIEVQVLCPHLFFSISKGYSLIGKASCS